MQPLHDGQSVSQVECAVVEAVSRPPSHLIQNPDWQLTLIPTSVKPALDSEMCHLLSLRQHHSSQQRNHIDAGAGNGDGCGSRAAPARSWLRSLPSASKMSITRTSSRCLPRFRRWSPLAITRPFITSSKTFSWAELASPNLRHACTPQYVFDKHESEWKLHSNTDLQNAHLWHVPNFVVHVLIFVLPKRCWRVHQTAMLSGPLQGDVSGCQSTKTKQLFNILAKQRLDCLND